MKIDKNFKQSLNATAEMLITLILISVILLFNTFFGLGLTILIGMVTGFQIMRTADVLSDVWSIKINK